VHAHNSLPFLDGLLVNGNSSANALTQRFRIRAVSPGKDSGSRRTTYYLSESEEPHHKGRAGLTNYLPPAALALLTKIQFKDFT
jgi:hypothetical protein